MAMERLDNLILSEFPYQRNDVRADPLLDLYHVTLSALDDSHFDGRPWEVYGVIEVTDGDGDTYDIYNREEHDPEIIVPHNLNSFPITLLDVEPVCPPLPTTIVDIKLWEKVRGLELAKGTFTFDFNNKNDDLEVIESQVIPGQDGNATIDFSFVPVAIMARVMVSVYKTKDFDIFKAIDGPLEVYGSVVAHFKGFGGTYSTLLSSAEENEPFKVMSREYINLFRTLFTVSAYTCLTIEVNLCNHETCYLQIPPLAFGFHNDKEALSDDFCVAVGVFYAPAYSDSITERVTTTLFTAERKGIYVTLPMKEIKMEQQAKRYLLDRQFIRCTSPRMFKIAAAMEIFSVFVACDIREPLDLRGTIQVDSRGTSFVVDIDSENCRNHDSNPYKIPLQMKGPFLASFGGDHHKITVAIEDSLEQLLLCQGSIYASTYNFANPSSVVMFDRRICSIIPGNRGYAAVHYSVFSEAVQAVVKVVFPSNVYSAIHCVLINVSGAIVARYSSYVYSTSRDKERYSSILFSRSVASPSQLELNQDGYKELQLAKCVVPVPIKSSLIIDLELLVTSNTENLGGKFLKGIAEFEIGSTAHWAIQVEGCTADISVEWREVSFTIR